MSLSAMLCNLRLDFCVFDPFKADEGPAQAVKSAEPAQKQECASMSASEAVMTVQYYFEDDPMTVIEGSLLDTNGKDLMNATCIECRFYLKEDSLPKHDAFICTRKGESFMSYYEAKNCSCFKRKYAHENGGQ